MRVFWHWYILSSSRLDRHCHPIERLKAWFWASQAVMKALKATRQNRGFVETILHARVPIIKFIDAHTGAEPSCLQ